MSYDWLNRQTNWSDGTNTETQTYRGAEWTRVSTNVNGSTVKYLYDDENVISDYDSNNALTAFYVTPFLDQNISLTNAQGTSYYYTQDGLGSIRSLTNAAGAIVNKYDYTAFGEVYAGNTAEQLANRYTYTGREKSSLASAGAPMYYRWRSYSPSIGRFLWRDPIGLLNHYIYCDNEPILNYDPMGLDKAQFIVKVVELSKRWGKSVRRGAVNSVKIADNIPWDDAIIHLRNGGDVIVSSKEGAERLARAAFGKDWVRHGIEKSGAPKHIKSTTTGSHIFYGKRNYSSLAVEIAMPSLAASQMKGHDNYTKIFTAVVDIACYVDPTMITSGYQMMFKHYADYGARPQNAKRKCKCPYGKNSPCMTGGWTKIFKRCDVLYSMCYSYGMRNNCQVYW